LRRQWKDEKGGFINKEICFNESEIYHLRELVNAGMEKINETIEQSEFSKVPPKTCLEIQRKLNSDDFKIDEAE